MCININVILILLLKYSNINVLLLLSKILNDDINDCYDIIWY